MIAAGQYACLHRTVHVQVEHRVDVFLSFAGFDEGKAHPRLAHHLPVDLILVVTHVNSVDHVVTPFISRAVLGQLVIRKIGILRYRFWFS